MSTILRSALVAVALIASASASMAAPRHHGYASYQSDSYGHEDARTFFDNLQRYGN